MAWCRFHPRLLQRREQRVEISLRGVRRGRRRPRIQAGKQRVEFVDLSPGCSSGIRRGRRWRTQAGEQRVEIIGRARAAIGYRGLIDGRHRRVGDRRRFRFRLIGLIGLRRGGNSSTAGGAAISAGAQNPASVPPASDVKPPSRTSGRPRSDSSGIDPVAAT